MATFSQSDIEKGCDMVRDFLCSACEEKKLEESAVYYCDSCVKFYCQKCIHLHGQLFTNHSTNGRGDMKKWPVAKKVEDFLLKCDVHKEENWAMFCQDHSQLCCNKCAFLNHRQCKTVMLLSDLERKNPTDINQVLVTIQNTLTELKELQDNQEASVRSVQSSFDEQLRKIQETRHQILATLDMLEQKTLHEMKDTLTKLQASIKNDVDKCSTFRDELKQLGNSIHEISDKNKQELSLIAKIKCQDKIQLFEKYRKNVVKLKSSITFQPNTEIVRFLSKLSGLGIIEYSGQTLAVLLNPDQIISIGGRSEYGVHIHSNREYICSIIDLCVLPSGHVLIADSKNNNVKLLNQKYQVVSHCSLSNQPWAICQITPSEFGVTFSYACSEVQFINVKNSQLVKDRRLGLLHECKGIAYHDGDLFVTTGDALNKYTLSGTLVSKLYKDRSENGRVLRCAVSPTGDKLFITNSTQHKLLTLARDGKVLATFMDPKLQYCTGVHVTPAGQVLVCVQASNTILQVDSTGSRKLATLAIEGQRDLHSGPSSVFYNSTTDSIIVGISEYDHIFVYKVN